MSAKNLPAVVSTVVLPARLESYAPIALDDARQAIRLGDQINATLWSAACVFFLDAVSNDRRLAVTPDTKVNDAIKSAVRDALTGFGASPPKTGSALATYFTHLRNAVACGVCFVLEDATFVGPSEVAKMVGACRGKAPDLTKPVQNLAKVAADSEKCTGALSAATSDWAIIAALAVAALGPSRVMQIVAEQSEARERPIEAEAEEESIAA